MLDVLIAGAGPAGSIAALLLARSGARVVILDRETFPRDRLCAGLLTRRTVQALNAVGLGDDVSAGGHLVRRTLMTGPRSQLTTLPDADTSAVVISRAEFDRQLLDAAIKAGARFESGVIVRRPLMDDATGLTRGLVLACRGGTTETRMPAMVTIGADGRHSRLARAAGLTTAPSPGRWAFGVEATGIEGVACDQAELHARAGWYLTVTPTRAGTARLCVVLPPPPSGRTPQEVIRRAISRDSDLAARFTAAEFVSPVRVDGPLPTSVVVPGAPGLLLAGDAAGAVDPLMSEGLMFAVDGGRLAAAEAARVIVDGSYAAAPWRLAVARREAFGAHLRLNRWVCRLADSPAALDIAGRWAGRFPSWTRRVLGRL